MIIKILLCLKIGVEWNWIFSPTSHWMKTIVVSFWNLFRISVVINVFWSLKRFCHTIYQSQSFSCFLFLLSLLSYIFLNNEFLWSFDSTIFSWKIIYWGVSCLWSFGFVIGLNFYIIHNLKFRTWHWLTCRFRKNFLQHKHYVWPCIWRKIFKEVSIIGSFRINIICPYLNIFPKLIIFLFFLFIYLFRHHFIQSIIFDVDCSS